MNISFDMQKDYFNEIRLVHYQLTRMIKKNVANKYLIQTHNNLNSVRDIVNSIPKFFRKILEPITTERVIGKHRETDGYVTPSVGKWFGDKGWKNITYFNSSELISKLSQRYIDLVPDPEKKAIAQDMFNLIKELKTEFNDVSVDLNGQQVTLYGFNFLQIRDMTQSERSTHSYGINDNAFTNYVYPTLQTDVQLVNCVVNYDGLEDCIKLTFNGQVGASVKKVEEIYIQKCSPLKDSDGKRDPHSISYFSEQIVNYVSFKSICKNNMHSVFFGDLNDLLVPEVQKAVNCAVAKSIQLENDWQTMQQKYAGNLLERGIF